MSSQPTQDERTIALLAHMLQILLWWIAPLAIFLIKRNSKFVSFHALQALLLQAVYVLTIIAGLVLAFGVFVLAVVLSPEGRSALPPEFYFLMPVLWLSWMGMGVVVLLAGIIIRGKSRTRRMGRVIRISDRSLAGF